MDVSSILSPRRRLVRVVLAALVVALLAPAAFAAVNPQVVELGPGTVTETASNETYVSVQGFHVDGHGNPKKPARLVAADGDAQVSWRFDGDAVGAFWFYDVDPLDDGDLLVSATNPDGTVLLEYDPENRTTTWSRGLSIHDTHDVTRLDEHRLLIANMRAYEDGVSDDRLYVWNATANETEWEWRFRDHYPNDTDGGFGEDWTHVNDVDLVGPDDRYVLASPRNFDEVVLVDRETGDRVMRLGRDGDHETLHEQHNPDYLEREDGTPVILVADSENDRVVEYERDCGDADPRLGAGTPPEDCEWDRVWAVDGFNWPRDADRLPDGNTLVTDSLNHRVVEITPEGEVVWEFHASWGPYDAERGAQGSNGPTMSDRGVTGTYTVHGGDDSGIASEYTVADAIANAGNGTGVENTTTDLASRWAHLEPWIRPVWMGSWAALSTALGALLALTWSTYELVRARREIVASLRTRIDSL